MTSLLKITNFNCVFNWKVEVEWHVVVNGYGYVCFGSSHVNLNT